MTEFYNNDFRLNLDQDNISFEESNNWLNSESGFVRYSIPFTKQWNKKDHLFYELLNSNRKRVYPGLLSLEGKLTRANIEILEMDFPNVESTLYYGLDEIPGKDRLLNSFDFPVIQVPNIIDHVPNVITGGNTDHFYNFPRVIKEYDTSLEGFENYSGFLNHFNSLTDYSVPGQILKPFPYLTRVVKHCLESQGYTVSGNFFTDEDLAKALLVTPEEFHFIGGGVVNAEFELEDLQETYFEIQNGQNVEVQYFKKSLPPSIVSYANLLMSVFVHASFPTAQANLKMSCNGVLLNEFTHIGVSMDSTSPDVLFDNPTLTPDQIGKPIDFELRITKTWSDEQIPGKFKIKVTALDGASIQDLTIVNPNFIDINLLFPETMTFGDLFKKIVTDCKTIHRVEGNEFIIDLPDKISDRTNAVDLTQFERKTPLTRFESLKSYELKFTSLTEYEKANNIGSLFYDSSGLNTGIYTVNENTESIEIGLRPLFFNTVNNVNTAEITTGEYIGLTFYDYNILPQDCINILSTIETWFNKFFKEFIKISIDPEYINLNFITDYRSIKRINGNSTFYAYNNYYLVSEISKEQLNKYTFNYNVEGLKIRY